MSNYQSEWSQRALLKDKKSKVKHLLQNSWRWSIFCCLPDGVNRAVCVWQSPSLWLARCTEVKKVEEVWRSQSVQLNNRATTWISSRKDCESVSCYLCWMIHDVKTATKDTELLERDQGGSGRLEQHVTGCIDSPPLLPWTSSACEKCDSKQAERGSLRQHNDSQERGGVATCWSQRWRTYSHLLMWKKQYGYSRL